MAIPIWVGKYVGIDFADHGRTVDDGLDCWGLVCLVYEREFGIRLPSFAVVYKDTEDKPAISAMVTNETENDRWDKVPAGQEQVGDVVVMRFHGQPVHVGIVIGDNRFLHIMRGRNVTHEGYKTPRWERMVYGFYRYAQ